MKFLIIISMFIWAISVISGQRGPRVTLPTPIHVNLRMVGNTHVQAMIRNTGSEDLKLLRTGTILDPAPINKVNVFSDVFKVPFEGFRPIIHAPFFQESDYQFLAAGEIITSTWDIGQVHDLSFGGNFTLYSEGFIPVVDRNGDITFPNPAPYRSNVLGISVDGPSAANVRHSLGFQAKRHVVQPDCTPTQLKQMNTALMLCASRAAAASAAAASGPPEKMLEYFKSDDPFTRSTVAAVFERAAAECRDGMSVKQHCIDVNQKCRSDAHLAYTDEKHLAYTNKKENIIGTCPAFWRLPSNLGDCRHADMGLVALHEATHLVHVGDTVDFACYDYGCAVEQLGAGQLLRHAQTYALFAQSLIGCGGTRGEYCDPLCRT